MANKFQHKRSTTGGATPTLSAGELAFNLTDKRVFTANDTTVFDAFQNTASSIAITNATGGVLSVGNSTVNAVINATHISIANSTNSVSFTSPTTAQKGGSYYLKADGTWSTVSASATAGGSNTYVQYNNSGVFNGTAGFTFDESTNNVTIANTLTVDNLVVNGDFSVNTDFISLGNSTVNATINSTALYITNSTVNTTLTIPSSAAWTATNYFLHANGSWVAVTAGGSPGGGAADVQYANNGTFAGNSGFQFTYTTNNVTIANTLTVGSTTVVNSTVINMNAGFKANSTALNPTANTILLGNTIGRWVITANSVATQGVEANATALNPTGNNILLGNSIGQWVITANSLTTTAAVVNATGITITVGGNTITANGTGLTLANSTGNTVTLKAPTTTEKGENRYLKVDGTWSTVTATASPGGSNTNIQFNDSTSMAGSNGFTFDKTTNNVYIANTLTVDGPLVINSDAFGVGSADANTLITSSGIYIANSTSNTKIEVPNTVMYSSTNYVLHANGSWITAPGGGAEPAGANTEIQYNLNAAGLGANLLFRYDSSGVALYVGNTTTTTAPDIVTQNSMATATLYTNSLIAGNSTANVNLTSANWKAAASKSITILDPVNTDSVTVFHTRDALTLSSIRAVVRGSTPSVTVSVYSATDRTATTTTHINANVVSNTTTGNTLTTFGSASIAANSFVYLTVTAVSGTVNEFHATLSFGVP